MLANKVLIQDIVLKINDYVINGSYITLIPNVDEPAKASKVRPISLLNISMKILTQLLANRLQRVITSLVHTNQYGFIQHCTIQDYLAWAFEHLHLCHTSQKEIVILKLDFEIAFDTVEHHAMLEVMKQKGFGDRWLLWMQQIFSPGTSPILLNGVPGKTFQCKRGSSRRPIVTFTFCLACRFIAQCYQ